MAAWLLYVKQMAAQPGSLPLWQAYLGLLPQEQDMCCLLNYSRAKAVELPGLVVSPRLELPCLNTARKAWIDGVGQGMCCLPAESHQG